MPTWTGRSGAAGGPQGHHRPQPQHGSAEEPQRPPVSLEIQPREFKRMSVSYHSTLKRKEQAALDKHAAHGKPVAGSLKAMVLNIKTHKTRDRDAAQKGQT
eukprot:265201-Pelagomonas_calceolata.AAC.1